MVSTFNWQGAPSATKQADTSARINFFAGLQAVVLQPGAISIVGAEQGAIDRNKQDSTRRALSAGARA